MAISFLFRAAQATGDVLVFPPFGTEVKPPVEKFLKIDLQWWTTTPVNERTGIFVLCPDFSRNKGEHFSKELRSGFGCSLRFWPALLERQTNREGFSQCGLNASWVMLAHSSFCLSEWRGGREELILSLSPSIFLKALGWDNASWAANFSAKTPGDTDQPLRPMTSIRHCGVSSAHWWYFDAFSHWFYQWSHAVKLAFGFNLSWPR